MSNYTEVTLHLDIVARTLAGAIFGNLEERVLVLRWESQTDSAEASHLVEMLGAELDACGAETLFYDTRRLADQEGSEFDAALRLAAITHSGLKQVAWLVNRPETVIGAEVEQHINACELKSCVATTFAAAVAELTGGRMFFVSDWKAANGFTHFEATYGGSCAFIPELKATVLRSAGNIFDLPAAQDVYERAFRLHSAQKGSAFIVDTSAIPPIEEVARYAFAFDALILPIVKRSDMEQVIHLRVGDPIFPPGAQTPQELAATFKNIEFVESSSMAEATRLIRLTRGVTKQDESQVE